MVHQICFPDQKLATPYTINSVSAGGATRRSKKFKKRPKSKKRKEKLVAVRIKKSGRKVVFPTAKMEF